MGSSAIRVAVDLPGDESAAHRNGSGDLRTATCSLRCRVLGVYNRCDRLYYGLTYIYFTYVYLCLLYLFDLLIFTLIHLIGFHLIFYHGHLPVLEAEMKAMPLCVELRRNLGPPSTWRAAGCRDDRCRARSMVLVANGTLTIVG